ncbi:MAG: hypothetical protein MUC83_16740 [Pirellula sp.]|jgi:hypothetical protein|nr:hypothetical protein [Pirellula sp.]
MPKFNGYEISADVSLPFLPGVRTFCIHGEIKHGDVASNQQLDFYRSLTQNDFPSKEELNDWAFKYFQEVARIIDVTGCGCQGVTRNNIDEHYEIQCALVPPLWGSVDRYLVLGGNCDWDDEHGIQMIIKNATVIKCGESDGIYQGLGWDALIGHKRPLNPANQAFDRSRGG